MIEVNFKLKSSMLLHFHVLDTTFHCSFERINLLRC